LVLSRKQQTTYFLSLIPGDFHVTMHNINFDEEPEVAIVDNQLILAVSLLHSKFCVTMSTSITQSGKPVSTFVRLLLNHQKVLIFLKDKFKRFPV